MSPASSGVNPPPTVRILAMMEAASVTGPAKNLIGFCRWLRSPEGAQAGLDISIVTFDRNARASAADGFVDTARRAGIATYLIRERHRLDPGVRPQLREIVATARPDILQTHNSKSHLLLRSLPELRRGRLWFAFQHGYTYPDLKQRLYNQVDRVSLRAADRVVSVCQAFVPRLVAFGVRPERIRVLHNAAAPLPVGWDTQRSQLREELGIRVGEAVILSVGRLSREKGHADLLRALARLDAVRPWKLLLVGIGPEHEALGRATFALGIDGRVVITGFRPDVARLFSIADLFVLPSHSEGSANVLLEAMMARVPIVATRAGGNPEIVLSGDTGLLVPAGDRQQLAGAIGRLLCDPGLAARLAEAAFARVAQEFSLQRYRARLCGYYAEALGTANRAGTGAAAPSAATQ
jgi:glycosyltransferase involved in cell wall biosynthesis